MGWRSVTAGYSFAGVCYPSTAAALAKFNAQYPQLSASHALDLVSSSVSGSTLTYALNSTSFDSGVTTARTGELIFHDCDSGDWANQEGFSWVLIVACVVLFALGFKAGQ